MNAQPFSTDADLRRFVWIALEPFDGFREKSAAALVALRRVLADRRPLAGGEAEFLDLYARVVAGDAAAFTAAFNAPQSRAWTAAAFRLCAAAIGGRAPEAAAALARQLQGFKALVLGQHWLAGRDVVFSTPLAVTPPFSVPATGWILFGPPAEIEGLEDGRLCVREAGGSRHRVVSGAASGAFALRAAPRVELDGAAIELDPFPLAVSDLELGGAAQAAAAGLDYHASQLELVRSALPLVARHAPESWRQLREEVRVIALQPPGASDFLAASCADAPGGFVCSAVACRHELANFFIHELHHARMFALEALAPVLALAPHEDPAIHYSPWRDDARPLRGLLHGVYVQIPVAHYWLGVHAVADAGPTIAGLAADRAARIALQLDVAIVQLERHGRWNAEGRRVFDEIRRAAREAQAAVRRARLSGDLPSWTSCPRTGHAPERTASGHRRSVSESLREHARRFDPTGEAAKLLASA